MREINYILIVRYKFNHNPQNQFSYLNLFKQIEVKNLTRYQLECILRSGIRGHLASLKYLIQENPIARNQIELMTHPGLIDITNFQLNSHQIHLMVERVSGNKLVSIHDIQILFNLPGCDSNRIEYILKNCNTDRRIQKFVIDYAISQNLMTTSFFHLYGYRKVHLLKYAFRRGYRPLLIYCIGDDWIGRLYRKYGS